MSLGVAISNVDREGSHDEGYSLALSVQGFPEPQSDSVHAATLFILSLPEYLLAASLAMHTKHWNDNGRLYHSASMLTGLARNISIPFEAHPLNL